jgi:hypothetical protein
MFLINALTGEKEECEICRRNAATPVLLINRKKIYPQYLKHFIQLLYASPSERAALAKGGYRIDDAPDKPLRLIP